MYLYNGKLYAENQHRELMTLIQADIRKDRAAGVHIAIGEHLGRLFGAKDAYHRTLSPYHIIQGGTLVLYNQGLRNRDRQRVAPEVVVATGQRRHEEPSGPARERIILEANELDGARITRRKKSRLEVE